MIKIKLNKLVKNNLVILICLSFIIFLFSLLLFYLTMSYQKVYSGITVENIDVNDLSKSELKKKLTQIYKNVESRKITVKIDNYTKTSSLSNLSLTHNSNELSENIFKIGREGNLPYRIGKIFSLSIYGSNLTAKSSFDEKTLNSFLSEISKSIYIPATEISSEISNDTINIIPGKEGKELDMEKSFTILQNYVKLGKSNTIELPTKKILPKKADYDLIYSLSFKKEKNAAFKKDATSLEFESEENGHYLDEEVINTTVEKINSGYLEKITLPLIVLKPQQTVASMKEMLYKDLLGTYTTSFSLNSNLDFSRKNNIQTSSNYINGSIIMPNKEFSFNKIVGKRTTNRGFTSAKVFGSNEIIDSVGGGICQAVSTIHVAAINSGLTITERHPHVYWVYYIPLGTDAAVFADAGQDLRFKNTTNWPIKIESFVSDNNITFNIYGTNERPHLSYKLETELLNVTNYSRQYVTDPSKVHVGWKGYEYNTYLVTYDNGVEVDRKKQYYSYYAPYDERIMR